jgi:hypothetical protein
VLARSRCALASGFQGACSLAQARSHRGSGVLARSRRRARIGVPGCLLARAGALASGFRGACSLALRARIDTPGGPRSRGSGVATGSPSWAATLHSPPSGIHTLISEKRGLRRREVSFVEGRWMPLGGERSRFRGERSRDLPPAKGEPRPTTHQLVAMPDPRLRGTPGVSTRARSASERARSVDASAQRERATRAKSFPGPADRPRP